ncbi:MULTISPECIES: hypothetical protein [unclassified Streptomyces]|uniref:hypothetical protein n=1 Tax=unclassified Streptomyces TaxID=2593676 RepID=UPI000445B7A5|nr:MULTISPECIES: hypothetical protein [unclassified Streptomyces]EXU62135.1 hypothetical protein Z951_43235 [Streptomyces sp. PRh5]
MRRHAAAGRRRGREYSEFGRGALPGDLEADDRAACRASLEAFPSEGGWFGFAWIDWATPLPAYESAARPLDKAGALVAPGTAFFHYLVVTR